MIPYEDAVRTVLEHAPALGAESVVLSEAAGRVLAEDVVADRDMPPRDLSAMDGYACRREDVDGSMQVIETIAAGSAPASAVGPGQCAQIMTGAPLPDGADTVVMVEHTTRDGDTVRVEKAPGKTNIRYRGEEIEQGALVLPRGTILGPAQVAALASVGQNPVTVSAMPAVGVIATGDELVEPGRPLESWQIRNSNSYQLCAQIERAGCRVRSFGIAPDEPERTRDAIETAARECDVLLLSGGVSMGEFDFVPGVLATLGVKLLFDKVAVQPGRPTVFGLSDSTAFFGLPGNPVSTYVLFELMVRPFLARMMGARFEHRRVHGRLAQPMTRRKADRLSFRPARLAPDGMVTPLEYCGSGHIHAYVAADGVVAFPRGEQHMAAGTTVAVILL